MSGKYSGILLASDFDSTLAAGGCVSEENIRALQAFAAEGGTFLPATGRAPAFAIERCAGIPFDRMIALNGTLIWDVKHACPLWRRPMNASECRVAWEAFRMFRPFIDNLRVHHLQTSVPGDAHTGGEILAALREKPFKVVYGMDTEPHALFMEERVRAVYGDTVAVDRSWATGVEIHARDSGKAEALRALRQTDRSIHTVVAVGDYENDVSMIRYADIGYAVANALPTVRQVADRIAPACTENAIAYIIEELGK